jgi:hypothetical protein
MFYAGNEFFVILACPESFFTIPDKQEGFPSSGNDKNKITL